MGAKEDGARQWLLAQPARGEPRFKLFCFPYAGGGVSAFHGWGAELPDGVEVLALRLPGRGNRLREPALTDMSEMVEALREALAPELRGRYGFFGHSMGGRIAFELTRALLAAGDPLPARLWISASRAPRLPPRRTPAHTLPEGEFLARVREYQGLPPEVISEPELLAIYLPLLRADLTLHESYRYRAGPPLPVPFTLFGGLEDEYVLPEDLSPWAAETDAGSTVELLPGGHLFLKDSRSELLRRIARDLR